MPNNEEWSETLVEQKVTYSIEVDGQLVIIEDVPARVNVETGEKHFSPETVERLQQAVWEQYRPVRTIETPVYEYTVFVTKRDSKLNKWLKWMETIQSEIQKLLRDTNMFWEVQDIIRENPRIQKPSAFYSYLGRTYLSHALAGLRRQIKPQKDSISFVGLLVDIANNPEELSRSYYRSLCSHPDGPDISQIEMEGMEELREVGVTGNSQLKDLIQKDDFAPYADASGEHVCPQMVKDDIDKLQKAAKACEDFADKRIAHWDKGNPTVVPTFGELDDCIKLLDETYVKYHLLFYAEGTVTLMPTYQYEWKKIFLEPWLKTGFGSAKGLIHIGEDFDDELPDFKEYME